MSFIHLSLSLYIYIYKGFLSYVSVYTLYIITKVFLWVSSITIVFEGEETPLSNIFYNIKYIYIYIYNFIILYIYIIIYIYIYMFCPIIMFVSIQCAWHTHTHTRTFVVIYIYIYIYIWGVYSVCIVIQPIKTNCIKKHGFWNVRKICGLLFLAFSKHFCHNFWMVSVCVLMPCIFRMLSGIFGWFLIFKKKWKKWLPPPCNVFLLVDVQYVYVCVCVCAYMFPVFRPYI